jgi:cytochrome c biogenesis protein CcmG/thiol:disulfide interchange protein DsbE
LINLGNPYHKIGSDKNGESAISWGVYGIPETFLIDSDNKIVVKIAGPITQSVYKNRLKEFLDP